MKFDFDLILIFQDTSPLVAPMQPVHGAATPNRSLIYLTLHLERTGGPGENSLGTHQANPGEGDTGNRTWAVDFRAVVLPTRPPRPHKTFESS